MQKPLLKEYLNIKKNLLAMQLSAKFWALLLGLAGDNHEAGAVGGGDEPTEENRLIRTLVKFIPINRVKTETKCI